MTTQFEISMYGAPEQKAIVEVDGDDCPWCRFVYQNVQMQAGSVVFLSNGDRIRRVCALVARPVLALACNETTPEAIERELGQFAKDDGMTPADPKPRRSMFTAPRGMQEWPLEEATIVRVPWNTTMGRAELDLHPQRRCRPFALLTWGCRPESTVHSIRIGHIEQLLGPVPGGAFPCMVEYADFERLLDKRADGHDAVRALWRLFSYQDIDLPTVELGGGFSITLEGPFEHVVFLTKMPVLEEGRGAESGTTGGSP